MSYQISYSPWPFQSRDRHPDSHAFMESLEKDIEDSDSGSVVHSTRVVRVVLMISSHDGWSMVTENGEPDALLTRTLVNSIHLSGPFILDSIPSRMNHPQRLLPMYVLHEGLTSAQACQMCGILYYILGARRWHKGTWFRRIGDALYSGPFKEYPLRIRY